MENKILVVALVLGSLFNFNSLAGEPLNKMACYFGECFTKEVLATCPSDPTVYFDERVTYRTEEVEGYLIDNLLELIKLRDVIINNQNHTLHVDIDLKIFSLIEKVIENSTNSLLNDRALREAIKLLSSSKALLISKHQQLKLNLLLEDYLPISKSNTNTNKGAI
jgi:hypothetical protein